MRMGIKMVVMDLDGTLLRTDKTISVRTWDVLNMCRESGVKIVYATGRGGSDTDMAPIEMFDGRVTMNGAVAKTGDKTVYNCLIPYQTARQLLVSCDRRGLRIASQANGIHYSNFVVPDAWPWLTNYEIVDFLSHDRDAEKIYALDLSAEDSQFIINQLPATLYMITAVDGLAMIMNKGATKSKAISELARLWGVVRSEIVAFGDDLNDMDTLLSYAGIGVAVGNALDEVKAIADCVCDTNDNDGVAKWLEEKIFV